MKQSSYSMIDGLLRCARKDVMLDFHTASAIHGLRDVRTPVHQGVPTVLRTKSMSTLHSVWRRAWLDNANQQFDHNFMGQQWRQIYVSVQQEIDQ
ncbi:MAG: hypothetical protein HOI35_07805 [Woeseia sp.]|jgi:hypothetical protein|nr:hypothetical protein [Woeseia sp.]